MKYIDQFGYCPRCGTGLEVKDLDGQKIPVCTKNECKFEFWPAMHPAVSVIMQNEKGQVLITVRAKDPGRGKLDFPGGFVKYGELPEAAAIREIKEEVGVDIEVTGLMGFAIDDYPYQKVMQLNLAIGVLAEIVNGEPRIADAKEVAEVKWMDMDEIAGEDLAFECDRVFIKALS